jgi:hypothetical protein
VSTTSSLPLRLIAAPLILFIGSAAAQTPCENGTRACREIIVRLHPNQAPDAVATGVSGSVIRAIPGRRTFLIQIPQQANFQTVLSALSNDQRVAWAEPNYLQGGPSGMTQSFFLSMTPNPIQVTSQYAAPLIGIPEAHLVSRGAGTTIAVLDTGLDPTHPAFDGRIAPGGWNFLTNTADFADVGNGLDDNGNNLIDELTGHGTMVSGLVLLVAPQAQILPLKILNSDGVGTAFAMAQAIDAAVAAGAQIINISAGSTMPSVAVRDAVNNAAAANCLVVAAVGNANRESPRLYPAGHDSALAVAGTDADDIKAQFSDYGDHIILAAPAVDIVGPFPGAQYATANGTSFATPLVSGTAALIRSAFPATPVTGVTSFLGQGSIDITLLNPAYAETLGHGRLHAGQSMLLAIAANCYANCDESTTSPILSVADINCFFEKFAAGHPEANCDLSTEEPILTATDIACFLQQFTAGCP